MDDEYYKGPHPVDREILRVIDKAKAEGRGVYTHMGRGWNKDDPSVFMKGREGFICADGEVKLISVPRKWGQTAIRLATAEESAKRDRERKRESWGRHVGPGDDYEPAPLAFPWALLVVTFATIAAWVVIIHVLLTFW